MAVRFALVRGIANSFLNCLQMEKPECPINFDLALKQHGEYVKEIKKCVSAVIEIPADDKYPDCCFIEDPVVCVGNKALINILGADPRKGEQAAVREELVKLGLEIIDMQFPGTLDGGDIIVTSKKDIFVGISKRTNMDGYKQLKQAFSDYDVWPITVRAGLHLKSLITFVKDTLIITDNAVGKVTIEDIKKVTTKSYKYLFVPEEVCANVIDVNGRIFFPEGTKKSSDIIIRELQLKENDYVILNMSELQKADGRLSCCSVLIQS